MSRDIRNGIFGGAQTPPGSRLEAGVSPVTGENKSRLRARAGRFDRCKILLVDDYPDLQETTSLLVEALGHHTRAVDNAPDAVLETARFDPDIVFLDIAMPQMDGFEAASAIRLGPNGKRPFLVALTALSSPGIETPLVRQVSTSTCASRSRRMP